MANSEPVQVNRWPELQADEFWLARPQPAGDVSGDAHYKLHGFGTLFGLSSPAQQETQSLLERVARKQGDDEQADRDVATHKLEDDIWLLLTTGQRDVTDFTQAIDLMKEAEQKLQKVLPLGGWALSYLETAVMSARIGLRDYRRSVGEVNEHIAAGSNLWVGLQAEEDKIGADRLVAPLVGFGVDEANTVFAALRAKTGRVGKTSLQPVQVLRSTNPVPDSSAEAKVLMPRISHGSGN